MYNPDASEIATTQGFTVLNGAMERVLKRVGLSKRTTPNTKVAPTDNEETNKSRRRRHSKSHRRTLHNQEAKKTRGLFNIDWDSVKDCKSCKSKALTKRFCSKKCDNELYRSNSFKFERFVRGTEEGSTLGKKISVCDDYSLPFDHLNKKRPYSIAVPSLSDWNISSPNEEKVKILDTYSTPKDNKEQPILDDADQKCFTSPDREYSQPYTTDGSYGPSSDEEFFGHNVAVPPAHIELNSPDSIAEAIQPNVQSPTHVDIKRHPSPYYYSDLFKSKAAESQFTTSKKSETLVSSKSEYQKPVENDLGANNDQNRKNQKSWSGYHKKCRKKSSVERNNTERKLRKERELKQISDLYDQHELLNSPCVCVITEDVLDDMSRQRHVYETAFDCRISKSDDDLDQIDKVSNHPVLVQFDKEYKDVGSSQSRRNPIQSKLTEENSRILGLSQKLENMKLPNEGSCTISTIPLRGYTPSPPSTAPLPTKFHGKELSMNSIRSAPNLPSHSKAHLKNLHLPIKSFRGCSPTNSYSFDIQPSVSKFCQQPSEQSRPDKDNRVLEIKDRPRDEILLFKRPKDSKGTILEFKGRRRRHKYSSTESMTSSSGGSMESIKSSTSEGNRSTTSTDSRNSSSLSSHDSDFGAASKFLVAQSTALHMQSNKLCILSPISDKSSQEPVSEISDNNRNNNSQKCSPEEVIVETKTRRRLPQNKNLLNLSFRSGDPEIQGSDSGISIQSREGIKSRLALTAPSQTDFSDLPFDMPKLRRRRMGAHEACTSGSATSIDFGELPFDMPKLRRRLRVQQSAKETCGSHTSSSQSVMEPDTQVMSFRPKLTLNLLEICSKERPKVGLSLVDLGLSLNKTKTPSGAHDIDINLPLEKQGWFHGAITRVEAENVLRLLREGSFLVRNSESTKQDYSLSLKSARGFMHMRIQRDDTDGIKSFVLGQFSKPFNSIPEMILHFSLNGLPIRGAEHMCLVQPVIAQLL